MATQRLSRGIITGPALPGKTGVTLLARIRGGTGQLITAASLASIAWTASNLSTGASLGSGTWSPVSSVVFDSLVQGDPRWQVDSVGAPGVDGASGFNFAAVIPAATFALATLAPPASPFASSQQRPQQIQADVVFTPQSGEPWRVSFTWQQVATYG